MFTNLTLDHLDYHKNFTNYKKSKAILFHKHTNQKSMAIINTNSINSSYFKKICKKKNIPILDYGKDAGFLKIKEIQKFEDFYEVNFVLKKKEFSIKFRCHLIYNVSWQCVISIKINHVFFLKVKYLDLQQTLRFFL